MTSRRSVHSTASAPWEKSSRSHAADSTVDDEVTQQSDVDVLSRSTRSWTRTSRGGVQEYTYIIHISSIIVARRPVYVRLSVGPGRHPQYTRADYGQEAVGGLCSPRAQYTTGTRTTRTVCLCFFVSFFFFLFVLFLKMFFSFFFFSLFFFVFSVFVLSLFSVCAEISC